MEMLDYFFRHYDELVTHYFIYDHGSDDGTLEYLARRKDVTVHSVPKTNPDSFALELLYAHQTTWKRSCGIADWVLVVDLDEHIWHPDLPAYLRAQTAAGVTAIPALGFQMLSREAPTPDIRLTDHLRWGAPWIQMSKLALFRPDALTDPGFVIGRHSSKPRGVVRYPERDELLLLHYKYVGFDRIRRRHAATQARRRRLDLEHNWGHRYAFDEAQLGADFNNFEARAIDIMDMQAPHDQHREPRWWRPAAEDFPARSACLPQNGGGRSRARVALSRLARLVRPRR